MDRPVASAVCFLRFEIRINIFEIFYLFRLTFLFLFVMIQENNITNFELLLCDLCFSLMLVLCLLCYLSFSYEIGGFLMLSAELQALLQKIQRQQCEEQTVEVKSAHLGCPEKLYDTYSSFANQPDGGILVFGLDERRNFAKVGVYDAQDLQARLMEIGEEMTPVVRPVLSVYHEDGLVFVSAEIPPVDLADRPCFKTSKGRMKGSYIRVGDGDKPMTEYEVYSYEAFRKQQRDDIRPVSNVSLESLNQPQVEEYLSLRKQNRSNLATVSTQQLYELTGITKDGQVTMMALLLFGPYPQAYFPQLSIIATRVPGTEMGELDSLGQRFLDSKRMEGNLPEMLESAMAFLRTNMRTALRIDAATGRREDLPEYPLDALREAVLNALVHRDYSIHTENMPIQLTMYADRVEIRSPGGLYGRLTLDRLGQAQPDTRNPFLITAMETLGQTENRYSGIPRIRHAMDEAGLPPPVFTDKRSEFIVCLYNRHHAEPDQSQLLVPIPDEKLALLSFCSIPRTRQEIADFLGIKSVQYAMKHYVEPLILQGEILLSIPDRPRSRNQTYRAQV